MTRRSQKSKRIMYFNCLTGVLKFSLHYKETEVRIHRWYIWQYYLPKKDDTVLQTLDTNSKTKQNLGPYIEDCVYIYMFEVKEIASFFKAIPYLNPLL